MPIRAERGKVPRVDELDGLVRLGGQDVAPARDAPRPVGEPVGVVVGANDEPGPDDKHAARHPRLGLPLAQHLERAVGLRAVNRFRRRPGQPPQRPGLVGAGRDRVT